MNVNKNIFNLKTKNQNQMKSLKLLVLSLVMSLATSCLLASNVKVDSVSVVDDSTLRFKISWENSWKVTAPPSNHDAVWIFIKRAECSSPTDWQHTFVSMNKTRHYAGSPLEPYCDTFSVKPSGYTEKVSAGLFLRRSSVGSGNISNVEVKVRLKGITSNNYNFSVFALEMVWINTEGFYLGDNQSGATGNGSYKCWGTSNGTAAYGPYYVGNNNAISVANTSGNLWAQADGSTSITAGTIPATYPKGYLGFYCMKNEMTQQMLADFFNYAPQQTYTTYWNSNNIAFKTSNSYGQELVSSGWGNVKFKYPFRSALLGDTLSGSSSPWRKFNYLNGTNFSVFILAWTILDWCGLRPMTELEYEKICRGPKIPIQKEYAWGTASVTAFRPSNPTAYPPGPDTLNFGTISETHRTNLGFGYGIAVSNKNADETGKVYRSGFAAKTGTDRTASGASYYGVMDMTGNAGEFVAVVYQGGQSGTYGLTGNNNGSCGAVTTYANVYYDVGDGLLTAGGTANQYSWNAWICYNGQGYRNFYGVKGGSILYSRWFNSGNATNVSSFTGGLHPVSDRAAGFNQYTTDFGDVTSLFQPRGVR